MAIAEITGIPKDLLTALEWIERVQGIVSNPGLAIFGFVGSEVAKSVLLRGARKKARKATRVANEELFRAEAMLASRIGAPPPIFTRGSRRGQHFQAFEPVTFRGLDRGVQLNFGGTLIGALQGGMSIEDLRSREISLARREGRFAAAAAGRGGTSLERAFAQGRA